MAISSETSSVSYTGNNSTSTAYSLTFPFSGASEIVVTHIEADGTRNTLAITTGYTLHGSYTTGTGTLKTVAAIPGTDTLLVERFTTATQSLSSASPAGSYPTANEAQLDRTTRAIQDTKRVTNRNFARSLRAPDGETIAELPAAASRAGKFLGFDDNGARTLATADEILADSAGGLDLSIGTVTTGAPGSSASASVSGTAPGKVLNLTIPRGATGTNPGTGERAFSGIPLDLPTPDDDPSVTHPSVVYIPTGWNGYKWWMAFTPWPTGDRELPNIVASNDGVNFEVPAGLTNPLYTQGYVNTQGYDYAADTELLLLADGLTMACYTIWVDAGAVDSAIIRQTSTDGITWSTPQIVVALGGTASKGSPCVVLEADGTYSMWTNAGNSAGTTGLYKRTSADGITWSAAAACTLPDHAAMELWHMHVARVGATYHMLVNTLDVVGNADYGGGRLYYLKSTDAGITWTGDCCKPAIPRLRIADFDDTKHYRSCLLPIPGEPLKWDIYVAGVPSGATSASTTPAWRIALFRDIILEPKSKPVEIADFLQVLSQTYKPPITDALWLTTVTNTGQSTASEQSLVFTTGTTNNSLVFGKPINSTGTAYAFPYSRAGAGRGFIHWGDRFRISCRIAFLARSAAQEFTFLFGAFCNSSASALTIDNKLIGFRTKGSDLYVIGHDGSTLTETDTTANLGAVGNIEEIVLETNGDGTITVTHNRSLVGTFTIGPASGFGTDNYVAPAFLADNKTTAADLSVVIMDLTISRLN